jgi:predicted kinase
MRKLYITRGIPGSGKSTLLEASGLGPYTISPDALRLSMAGPVLDESGGMSISAKHDRRVWELLRELLDERMARGEVIAVDGTHTTARYYNDYAQLAYRHRYQMFIVDLSEVPLEQAIAQNKSREAYKVVDEGVLRDMHDRLSNLADPKGWQILRTADEIKVSLEQSVLDFSAYTRVHHIGDIQGCYTPLAEYMSQNPLRDDEAFVFVGDMLDRGKENDKVLDYISRELVGKLNVYFVEGNHDLYVWQWLHGWPVKTREFNGRTRRQLEAADIEKPAVKRLLQSMTPALHYRHGERNVLVTHAGLSTLPDNLGLISAEQCIRGVGSYDQVDVIDDTFARTTDEHTFQIHGHRNRQNFPLQYNEQCFNLEGKVEFGGALRVVQLTSQGFTPVEVHSAPQDNVSLHGENADLVRELRNNRLITERTLPSNISSFHFRPEVMFKKKWSHQTLTTRGLFINTLTNEIVIRAYDKFFNVNETRETNYSGLQDQLVFPVTAWVKENGYLGLVGYDDSAGDLVISSKSTTEGEFADWFRERFEKHIAHDRQYVVDYLRDNNVTLLFEVVLPRHDPHIIDYAHDELILLDIVKRQREFEATPELEREAFGERLGMRCKQKATTLADWEAFEAWYASVQGIDYKLDGKEIEGFVVEDSNGWRMKIKLDYYSFWKQMRSALDSLKKGRSPKVPVHSTHPEEALRVIAFMEQLPKEQLETMSISEVRRLYAS